MNAPEPKKVDKTPEWDDDDAELELEPPDETVGQRQQQIALEAIRNRIDIEDIYREVDRDVGAEILQNWFGGFNGFRFQVKHLFIATAVLAIVLTLVKLELFWTSFIVLAMISVISLYSYIRWQERKHEIEADRQREKLYALRRAKMAANQSPSAALVDDAMRAEAELPNQVDETWHEPLRKEPFRIQFSTRQLLIVMTASAVALAMIRWFGGPPAAASVLGLVALFGLVVYECGSETPQTLVLAWWLILAMYVLTVLMGAVWSAFA